MGGRGLSTVAVMVVKERLHSCTWVVRKGLLNKAVLEQRVKGREELVLQIPEA